MNERSVIDTECREHLGLNVQIKIHFHCQLDVVKSNKVRLH